MSHAPFIKAGTAKLLSNLPDCATLMPTFRITVRVQDICRKNRETRQAATLTAMQEVQCP